MRRLIVGLAVLLVFLVLLGRPSIHAATIPYSVTDLGDLPGGDDFSGAKRINEVGQVIGLSETADGHHGFLYSDGVMTDIGVLNGHHNSQATDINDAGQIAGRSIIDESHPSSLRPILYSNGTMTELGSFGGDYGFAYGINNSTEVVGLSSYANGVTHAFLWSNGSMIDLGNLGDPYSCAYDINNSQVVGNRLLNGAGRGFIWENGVMTDLGDLPGGPETTRA